METQQNVIGALLLLMKDAAVLQISKNWLSNIVQMSFLIIIQLQRKFVLLQNQEVKINQFFSKLSHIFYKFEVFNYMNKNVKNEKSLLQIVLELCIVR